MGKKLFWGTTLPGCFVLALVLGMLAPSGNSLADPPDGDGNHNHGGAMVAVVAMVAAAAISP